jgi:hypothetical protein
MENARATLRIEFVEIQIEAEAELGRDRSAALMRRATERKTTAKVRG